MCIILRNTHRYLFSDEEYYKVNWLLLLLLTETNQIEKKGTHTKKKRFLRCVRAKVVTLEKPIFLCSIGQPFQFEPKVSQFNLYL